MVQHVKLWLMSRNLILVTLASSLVYSVILVVIQDDICIFGAGFDLQIGIYQFSCRYFFDFLWLMIKMKFIYFALRALGAMNRDQFQAVRIHAPLLASLSWQIVWDTFLLLYRLSILFITMIAIFLVFRYSFYRLYFFFRA